MGYTKYSGRARPIPSGLAIGVVTSTGITVILSWVSAGLISKELIPESYVGYCAIVTLMLGSLAGALTAVGCIKKMTIKISMFNGGIFYLVLLSVTALFFGGQYDGMGVTLITILIGSGAGGILAGRERKTRKTRGYQKPHRKLVQFTQ